MPVAANEYHPYIACLAFKASKSSTVVRENLSAAIREARVEGARRMRDAAEGVVFDDGWCGCRHCVVCWSLSDAKDLIRALDPKEVARG